MQYSSSEFPSEFVGRDDESDSGGVKFGFETTTPDDVDETNGMCHSGKLLIDATVCPKDIAFPADLKLLNVSREKSETLIDKLFDYFVHGRKNRGPTALGYTIVTLIW